MSGVVQNRPHFSRRDPTRYPYDLASQTGPDGSEGDVIVDQGAGASRVGCVEVVADKSAGVSDVRDFGKAVGIELRGDRRGSVDRIKPQIDMPWSTGVEVTVVIVVLASIDGADDLVAVSRRRRNVEAALQRDLSRQTVDVGCGQQRPPLAFRGPGRDLHEMVSEILARS